jgi:hypothetical protein
VLSTPLKNTKVSGDDYSQLNGEIKFMFQTTYQLDSPFVSIAVPISRPFPDFQRQNRALLHGIAKPRGFLWVQLRLSPCEHSLMITMVINSFL